MFFSVSTFSQSNNEIIFKKGIDNYNIGNYNESIENFLEIIKNGEHSKELYFNLGNCYYKINDIANSIYFYEKALKLDSNDIDLVELHDCFATAEMLHYENLGLCEDGEAGRLIDEGEVELGGRIPVNVSGGLLSKGHPLGATGIANIYEVCTHLRGEAGKRQVENAKIGMTHVIGLGSACGIHILEKV